MRIPCAAPQNPSAGLAANSAASGMARQKAGKAMGSLAGLLEFMPVPNGDHGVTLWPDAPAFLLSG